VQVWSVGLTRVWCGMLALQFRVPEWKPHWSEREGALRWYLYRMCDCVKELE
jgi:hypothetical protein